MRAALPLLMCLLPYALPVQASTYCCDVPGSTICDEGLPPRCIGKAYRELDDRGVTLRTFEAPLTPEQRAKREADLVKKKQEDERLAAEERVNRKLLGTYDTVKDLDESRGRVIEDHVKSLKLAQEKLADAQKKKLTIDNEVEFYKKRSMPEPLRIQLKDVVKEIMAQEKNVTERTVLIENAQRKFSEDRTRFLMLTARKQSPAVTTQ